MATSGAAITGSGGIEIVGEREIRIAAVGDLHYESATRSAMRDLFLEVNRAADILVLCGDLTTTGRPDQMQAFAEETAILEVPVVAVLGNHDHDGEAVEEAAAILDAHGVQLLDGRQVTIQGVGFAGVKGFAGGFGRGTLAPFGEALIKEFVQHAIDEALKLENALRSLETEEKVVVLHYSPIPETIVGEPEAIYPFLGSSRLLTPLETHGATVIFHGHAHHGTAEGRTPAGIPVFNVALPVLQRLGQSFRIWNVSAPDRRGSGEAVEPGGESQG
jgi:Icc-related predicted phosphoesterase